MLLHFVWTPPIWKSSPLLCNTSKIQFICSVPCLESPKPASLSSLNAPMGKTSDFDFNLIIFLLPSSPLTTFQLAPWGIFFHWECGGSTLAVWRFHLCPLSLIVAWVITANSHSSWSRSPAFKAVRYLKPWLDNLTLNISWAAYAKDFRFISAPPHQALWNKIEGTVIIPTGNRGFHGFHDLSEA